MNAHVLVNSAIRVLNAASANVTTVLVAHKLQTVVDADLILVMSDGLLVEQGTHTSLLCQANSTYSRMWAEQASGFGGAARAGGEDLDYCKLALDDQPYVPWSAASPARSKLPLLVASPRGHHTPEALPFAQGHSLGPSGEPLSFGRRREAAAALWRLPTVADSTALDHPGRPGGCHMGEGLQQQTSRPAGVRIGRLALVSRWPRAQSAGVKGGGGVSTSCDVCMPKLCPIYIYGTWKAKVLHY